MYFSKLVPVLGALMAGVQASPAPMAAPLVAERTLESSTKFDLAATFDKSIIFDGLAPSSIGAVPDCDLHVQIPHAVIQGGVDVKFGAEFLLAPTLVIDLSGVQAYVELDIKAEKNVYFSFELVKSAKLGLDIPGLDIEAALALALDLVISLDIGFELSAGLYIDFPVGSYVKVDLLTSKVIEHVLDDLVTKALPLTIGADVDFDAQVTLQVGLRLRTEVGIDADVVPFGIPLLSAGADVAVWINLCEYKSVIIGHPSPDCNTGVQEYLSLDVGVVVELNVDVLDVLDLSLAPTVSFTLAAALPSSTSCVANCLCSSTSSGLTSSAPSISASSSSASTASTTASTSTTPGSSTASTSASTSASSSSGSSSSSSSVPSTLSYGNGTTSTSKPSTSAPYTSAPYTTSSAPATSAPATSAPATTTPAPVESLTTSTYFETTTLTITSCAATVVNCPATLTQKVVTSIVVAKTTVCPVSGATGAATPPAAAASTTAFVVPKASLTSGAVTYTTYPASSAPANTFTCPSSITAVVPTVTLTAVASTVTPVAATTAAPTKPAKVATGSFAGSFTGSFTGAPSASFVTAPSYKPKPTGAPTPSLTVTAGAAKAATHAGAFLAIAAGLMLAF